MCGFDLQLGFTIASIRTHEPAAFKHSFCCDTKCSKKRWEDFHLDVFRELPATVVGRWGSERCLELYHVDDRWSDSQILRGVSPHDPYAYC